MLDPLLACELAVSAHNANAIRALAKRQMEATLTSLDQAIILCEASPTLAKDAGSNFRLLAKLVGVCRRFCEEFRPNKVDDALKLVSRVDKIEGAGSH